MKHLTLLILLGTLLSGCQKLVDLYQRYESEQQPQASACRVDSVYPASATTFTMAAGIHYNAKGNPDTVFYTYYDEINDLRFQAEYRYDELDRLVAVVPDFIYLGPKEVDYTYEGNSRLPKSSRTWDLYAFLDDQFFYDEAGRMNRIVRHITGRLSGDTTEYPDVEYKFVYDESGNRQPDPSNENYSGPVEYTDKPSIYSLHPVWQIVHWDFSRNSLPSVETYNENGYPLKYKQGPTYQFQTFLQTDSGPGYKFSYTCPE